jgi:hypothetical protein
MNGSRIIVQDVALGRVRHQECAILGRPQYAQQSDESQWMGKRLPEKWSPDAEDIRFTNVVGVRSEQAMRT